MRADVKAIIPFSYLTRSFARYNQVHTTMKVSHTLRILLGTAVVGAFASPFITLAATPSTTPACPYTWSGPLSIGSTGPDVMRLQQFLNSHPGTKIASYAEGSPGHETSRFGGLTKIAVAKFQEKYASDILVPNGMTKGTGLVGPATRTKLNALCSSLSAAPLSPVVLGAATTTVATPLLKVASGQQPATTLAPANALYVPFTNATVTAVGGEIVIHSITVDRIGPAQDQAFVDVDLFDTDGTYYAIGYLNSIHRATFRKDITVPAGTSLTLQVVGDMASSLTDYEGQMAGFRIIAIDASAPVENSLPILGTLQTINSNLTIGNPQTTVSAFDPMTARTRYINDTGVIFSAIRVTADSIENEKLTSIAWRQVGSAAASDLTNVVVIVNGQSYPTTIDERNYSASFGDGIKIAKGNAVDIEIKGDLTWSGSNRTVQFNINDGADIGITGETYGFGLFPIASDHTDTLDSGNHSIFATSDGTTDGASMKPYYIGSITNISGAAMISIGR